MSNGDLLATYLDSLPPGPAPSLRIAAEAFCSWLKKREPDRALVDRWIAKRRKDGYAAGTLSFEFGVIRRIFRTNGLEWPFRRGEGPTIGERDVYAPSLDSELVGQLINASASLSPEHRACLALSTTYGVRRAEIMELHPASFDWQAATVYIETVKAGRQRYHLVPPEILPHLKAHSWPGRGQAHFSNLFIDLKKATGFTTEQSEEVGWHSIRRSLTQVLWRGGFSEPEVSAFLRWKRSTSSMAVRYGVTTVIGAGGSRREPGLADADLDRRAFEVNPWLPVWAEVKVSEEGTPKEAASEEQRA